MKKTISFMLSLLLAFGLLQTGILAEEEQQTENTEEYSEITEEAFEEEEAEQINEIEENEEENTEETAEIDEIESVEADGKIQLDKPYNADWYGLNNEGVYTPGYIYFECDGLTQDQFYVETYCNNEKVFAELFYSNTLEKTGSAYIGFNHYFAVVDGDNPNAIQSGDYYFTVTTRGDNIDYISSEAEKSDTWHFERAEQRLNTVTSFKREDNKWKWQVPENSSLIGGYSVRILKKDTLDGEVTTRSAYQWVPKSNIEYVSGDYVTVNDAGALDYYLDRDGSGYYAVQVKLLSKDMSAVFHSDWSVASEYVYFLRDVQSISEEMDYLVENEGLTNAEIRDVVQALDTNDLRTAMYTDSEVLQKMEELESRLGGSEIEVTDAMSSVFDESDMKMIGAALNTPENEAENIKLVVDRAKKDDVIPTLYNSTIAVKFSMELENVHNTEELKVPVKIILPVPETINPSFMVILHYHVNGDTPEEIRPYIFEQNGKKYASFVLTSFSDFVMTERDASVNGLIQDNDGTWRLYQNGEVRTNFTGLYPYGTSLFHLTNGVLDKSVEGIEYYQKKPYYVVKGQVTYNYTGLGEYKGSLHYFTKSEKDESFNGIAYYKGEPYFVVNGKVTYNYVGLGEYKGSLHYFTKSKKDTTFTGLSYYKNEPYYVLNGIVSYKYNGLGQYKTDWWYVVKSKVDKSYSGPYRWKSKDYTIKNGKVVN